VDGIYIEVPGYGGPCALRKDGDPKQRFTKADKAAMHKLRMMDETEMEKYRVGGGCVRF